MFRYTHIANPLSVWQIGNIIVWKIWLSIFYPKHELDNMLNSKMLEKGDLDDFNFILIKYLLNHAKKCLGLRKLTFFLPSQTCEMNSSLHSFYGIRYICPSVTKVLYNSPFDLALVPTRLRLTCVNSIKSCKNPTI